MARFSHNPTPSDVGSANGAAVAAEQRAEARRKEIECGERMRTDFAAAEQWLAQFFDSEGRPQFADPLDGRPCPFAIEIAVRLRRLRGAGNVKRGEVAKFWHRRMGTEEAA